MGAGHAHALYRPGDTVLHRLPPQCKITAAFLFVLGVVAAPPRPAGYLVFGLLVAGLTVLGRVPPTLLARRLVLEVPFVAFAALLPFVARGERVEVLGLALSRSGLASAGAILAKATLGLLVTVILTATTPVRELLTGLERLRLPRQLVAVAGFMIRYADVVAGELHRMRVARESRGYAPRTLLHVRGLAASIGALFVRCFERGERVHLAMLSRGYDGALPVLDAVAAPARQWATALTLPAVGALVTATAYLLS
jgi:cobalt/nickel transport system permease protein